MEPLAIKTDRPIIDNITEENYVKTNTQKHDSKRDTLTNDGKTVKKCLHTQLGSYEALLTALDELDDGQELRVRHILPSRDIAED